MAGVLIGSALEAYEGDWKAIHGLWNQMVDVRDWSNERFNNTVG